MFLVEFLDSYEVLKVFMAHIDLNKNQSSFQKVMPFIQCIDNCENSLIMYFIVVLYQKQKLTKKGDWILLIIFFEAWNSMAPIAKSKLSASTQKKTKVSEMISMEAAVIGFFSISKATYYAILQLYVLLLLVISNRRQVISKKLQMNL